MRSPSKKVGIALGAIWLFFLAVAILGLVFIPHDSPSRIIAWFLVFITAGPLVAHFLGRTKKKIGMKKEADQVSHSERP
jgi:multisubunit Na+/H+ antiporter MnhG subunit